MEIEYSTTAEGEVGKPAGSFIERTRIYEILYADDCVLLAQSEAALQHMLNIFGDIVALFEQQVSVKKTKVMVIDRENPPIVVDKKLEPNNPPVFKIRGVQDRCRGAVQISWVL